MIYKTYYNSPVGKILIAAKDDAIIGLWIEGQKYYLENIKEDIVEDNEYEVLKQCKDWLDRYFRGEKPKICELKLNPSGSDFAKSVWDILCEIPYGETTTYGEIAENIAVKRNVEKMSAQAVGGAVGHNPISIIIPCHRVVGKSGSLTGYAGGIDIKIKLLAHEKALREEFFIPKKGEIVTMKKDNKKDIISKIQKSFTVQAKEFENKKMSFSKQEYLDYTIKAIDLKKTDKVLEVAAGTCVTGRAIEPFVSEVTCVDATEAMLKVGKEQSKKDGLKNIFFVEALAENLPFEDNTFDVVITRLSFHHFAEVCKPFSEMDRVLKLGGKLVIIDMEAAEYSLRKIEDEIETMRDFSHVKNLSKSEFEELYKQYKYEIIFEESTPIPVNLTAWMDLTKTPESVQKDIHKLMLEDICGKRATGFLPYMKNKEIYFNQRWLFILGIKRE